MHRRHFKTKGKRLTGWLLAVPVMILILGASMWLVHRLQVPIQGDPADPDQVALGSAFYQRDCARCHGQDLTGEFGWVANEQSLNKDDLDLALDSIDDVAPAHDASGQTWRHADKTLFEIVKYGPARALGRQQSRMPAFEKGLTDDDIWAVIAFLKSHWPQDLQDLQPEADVAGQ